MNNDENNQAVETVALQNSAPGYERILKLKLSMYAVSTDGAAAVEVHGFVDRSGVFVAKWPDRSPADALFAQITKLEEKMTEIERVDNLVNERIAESEKSIMEGVDLLKEEVKQSAAWCKERCKLHHRAMKGEMEKMKLWMYNQEKNNRKRKKKQSESEVDTEYEEEDEEDDEWEGDEDEDEVEFEEYEERNYNSDKKKKKRKEENKKKQKTKNEKSPVEKAVEDNKAILAKWEKQQREQKKKLDKKEKPVLHDGSTEEDEIELPLQGPVKKPSLSRLPRGTWDIDSD
jgi:hypothetical protein